MPFEDRLDELTPEQRELFERFLKRDRLTLGVADRYRAPRTAAEETLADIWSELLGVDPGIDDNYFELGGDSIAIIRMVSQARAAGLPLRTAWVFAHPTIAGLAALSGLEAPVAPTPARAHAWQEDMARIRAADPEFDRLLRRRGATPVDTYPLSPSQQGILFHALEGASDGSYVVQWRVRLTGRLDVPRFRTAWARVTARHEALRTIFQWVGLDEPMQVVLDGIETAIVEEQRHGDWHAIADAVVEEDRQLAFDLRAGPLVRIRFVRVADDEWLCCWSHHHLILDGWSQQVFLKDFFAAYRGLPLAPIEPGFFRNHVYWLRALDASSGADFWRRQLAGYQPSTRLPAKRGAVHAVARRTVSRPGRLRDALRREAVTLSVFYQAAWGLALTRVLGQTDVVFGVACSGRSSGAPGIEHAVGLFINTLPLRLTVDASCSFAAFLAMVQARQAQLVEHEWCGLAAVRSWIGWDRRVPLFETLYVYERFPLDLSQLDLGESLAIGDLATGTDEHYPLVFVVQDDEDATTLTLKHVATDGEAARQIEHLLDFCAALADRFIDTPGLAVGDLLTFLNAAARDVGSVSTYPATAQPVLRARQ